MGSARKSQPAAAGNLCAGHICVKARFEQNAKVQFAFTLNFLVMFS